MSYSVLMFVQENGEAAPGLELSNSHGTVTCVWDSLIRKYRSLIYNKDPLSLPAPHRLIFDEWEDLWKAAENDGLPLRWWEWNMLQWSYDNAMIKREHFAILAQSMRMFEEAHVLPNRVCHFTQIADALADKLAEVCDDLATCLYATSTTDNPWSEYNGETDESIPYNINTGTKHHFVDCRGPDWKPEPKTP